LKQQFASFPLINLKDLLTSFTKHAWNQMGTAPSGADLLSQLSGNIALINKDELSVSALNWPFEDLGFYLIRTGKKLATHEHLSQFELSDMSSLNQIVDKGLKAFSENNSLQFIHAINDYAEVLASMDLVASHTNDLLKLLSSNKNILACKGCGSMGADIVYCLYEKSQRDSVREFLLQNNLLPIANQNDLTKGSSIILQP